MNTMQQAMVAAGVITEKRACRVERNKEVKKIMNKEKKDKRLDQELLEKMTILVAEAPRLSREELRDRFNALSEGYPDNFDEIASNLAYRLNLNPDEFRPRLAS